MNKKELVKNFILECKQEQEWKKRWEANHIDFNNYFKYSGKVEERVDIDKRALQIDTDLKLVDIEDEVVRFYLKHPGYSFDELGYIFGYTYG